MMIAGSRTVLIATDSFKGSLSAADVAKSLAVGWRRVRPDDRVLLAPQADGGEGSLEVMQLIIPDSTRMSAGVVTGPDGRPVNASWLLLPNGTGFVELAASSGLPQMQRLDPLRATTRGLGEVICHALESGVHSLLVGLGGSASTDGGAGALSSMGVRFYGRTGDVELPDGGGSLEQLARIDCRDLLSPPGGGVTLLVDVDAPLLGPTGASATFAPQKGATISEVGVLERGLEIFSSLFGGKPSAEGCGAAGGTAYGLATAWGAEIVAGFETLASLSNLADSIKQADLVITGEGRFDEQSLKGKVVGGVLEIARAQGTPAGIIAGQVVTPVDTWSLALSDLAGGTEPALKDPSRWLQLAARLASEWD